MKFVQHISLIILLAAMSHSSLAQKVHRWTDENGVVHFSQIAPDQEQQPSEEQNLRTAPVLGGTLAPVRESEPAAEQTNNEGGEGSPKGDGSAQQPPTPSQNKNPAACQQAREMIATLNTGRRFRLTDPETGEMRYATESDITEQKKRANESIKRNCP